MTAAIRWFLVGVPLLVACAETQRSEPAKPVPETAVKSDPKPEAKPEGETKTLLVAPGDLSIDGDAVVYAPDSNVKKAKYEYYRFDKAAFQAKVGTPTSPIKLTVVISSTKDETYQPSDPNVQAPAAGFQRRVHTCTIVGVER